VENGAACKLVQRAGDVQGTLPLKGTLSNKVCFAPETVACRERPHSEWHLTEKRRGIARTGSSV